MAQVDPYAYQNAFGAQQDRSLRNRVNDQQQTQQAFSNDLSTRQVDARAVQQTRDNEIADQDRRTNLVTTQIAPFMQRALREKDPKTAFLSAIQNPQVRSIFEQAGFKAEEFDPNDPELLQDMQSIASLGSEQKPSAQIVPAGATALGPDGKPLYTSPFKPEAAPRAENFRPMTAQEMKNYGLPEGTTAQINNATGKVDLISRPTSATVGRPVPPAVAKGVIENNASIGKIDRALAALEARPESFGGWNYVGDTIRQRTDSDGVDARAKVADIGSLIIHDRSGAAVSASEFPRLAPFIPRATDTPKTVKTKLENLKANIQAMQDETQSIYSEEAGYKPMGTPAAQAAAAPQSVPTATGPNGQKLYLRNGQWTPQ